MHHHTIVNISIILRRVKHRIEQAQYYLDISLNPIQIDTFIMENYSNSMS